MLAACATRPAHSGSAGDDCIGPDAPQARPGSCGWPRDVRAFVARADLCAYWNGEMISDDEVRADPLLRSRQVFLIRSARRDCRNLDRRQRQLVTRHRHDAALMSTLSEFDPGGPR